MSHGTLHLLAGAVLLACPVAMPGAAAADGTSAPAAVGPDDVCAAPAPTCPFARLHCEQAGREELRDAASGSFRIRWRTRADCRQRLERPHHYRYLQPWHARFRHVDGLGIEVPGRGHRADERWPLYRHLDRGRPRHGDSRVHAYRSEHGVRRYSTRAGTPDHSNQR